MRKIPAMLVLCLAPALAQQSQPEKKITIAHLRDSVYVLRGGDANMVASVGADGVLLVDAESRQLVEKAGAALATVTDQPIRWVVNTHFHPDHTAGNVAVAPANIIAHENTRKRLSAAGKILGRDYPALPAAALPDVTYADQLTLHLNGEEVRLVHIPNAHTDGDTLVWFVKANVVHVGDTWEGKDFPFIDIDNGGRLSGIRAVADFVLSMPQPSLIVVPGHGAPGGTQDVRTHLDMLNACAKLILQAIRAGKTEEQVLADDPLKPYADWGKGFVRVKLFTRILYRDLSRSEPVAAR